MFLEDDESDTWPVRFTRLNNKYRTVTEQKVSAAQFRYVGLARGGVN